MAGVIKTAQSELTTEEIMRALDLEFISERLKQEFLAQYASIVAAVIATIENSYGISIGTRDDIAESIARAGGTRAGLIDLTQQTRDRLFTEIEQGLADGIGPEALKRRIRDLVPAGPWRDQNTRARVIARTEVLNAQRRSTIAGYGGMDNVTALMVFDNRIGHNDPECTALNGRIVSFEDADALAGEEHPNGTRSFAPVVE